MEIKILQVFYGKDGLPYKDQERTVHFPIVGSGFQGASNTTKIRFYYDELVEQDDTETAWVACAKLPNGKIGSKVLETDYDSTLGEHYALLELDSFYFQYKGDVYISLQGYQGGVQVDYDEETELYTIYGTPTIAATGSIKLSVNYATQFVGSGETSNVNFQRILADLGTKLGIRATSVFVEELPTVGNPDTFYVIHNDLSDPNKANIYIWNSLTEHYIWVGDNTLDLGNYYTQEQGDQFENDIDNRVTSVENELSSLGQGGPKGTYATVTALTTADPDHAYTYLVLADNKWYYWDGTQWSAGGTYLNANLSADYVPYTGATADVDLGTHKITARNAEFDRDGNGSLVVGLDSSYIEFKSGYYFNRKYNNVLTSFFLPPTSRTTENIATEYYIKTAGLSRIDGNYSTLAQLQSAFPTGNDSTYLITKESSWYYWNGTAWTKGGYYIENPNYVLSKADAVFNAKVFDVSSMCSNVGFLNNSGEFVANASYRTSDYLRVYANHNYKYNLRLGTTLPVIAFFTDINSSSFVSSVTGASDYVSGTFTPTQDGYVRIARSNSYPDGYFYDNTTMPDWAGGITTNTENYLNGKTLGYNSQMCFSIYNNVENAFLRNSGEKVSNSGYRTTAPIYVKQGQTIKYRLKHGTTLPIAVLYSSSDFNPNNFIEKVDGSSSYIEGTYTPSQNGYVAFCYGTSMGTDGYVIFQDNLPDILRKVDNNNVVAKLNILCMGDSIFGNDGEIPAYLNDYGKSCVNGAFGGTRVTDRGSGDFRYFDGINLITALTTGTWTNQDAAAISLATDYPWLPSRLTTLKAVDMSKVDVLIMDWGTNDYTASATIEQIIAAYSSIVDMLQTTYPKLRILVTTPIWRFWGTEQDNENGDNKVYNVSTLKQIAAAIESFCKDRRINVLNAYQELPLSYKNSATYFDTGDGTHLNSNGNLMYAHLLRGKLNSIF